MSASHNKSLNFHGTFFKSNEKEKKTVDADKANTKQPLDWHSTFIFYPAHQTGDVLRKLQENRENLKD